MHIFILVFIFTMVFSFWAAARVRSVFNEYSTVETESHLTGAEVAQKILLSHGINGVEIQMQKGMLGDHYDPSKKRLVLSRKNYEGSSIAAFGVAAHECGHAIQHKNAYAPLEWRMSSVWAVKFVSPLAFYLPLLGGFMGMIHSRTILFIIAVSWGLIMAFNLLTLPVEFDASKRAEKELEDLHLISGKEAVGVRKVLNAAAMTYVAAFVTSLLYFFIYLLPLFGGRR